MVKCLNCGNTFNSKYCPNCGQKASTKRLKLTEILMDFFNSFVGGDNKFAHTCHDICLHPGLMIRNYLLGQRSSYYNPLQYLIFLITIYAVISYFMGENAFKFNEIEDINLFDDNGDENRQMFNVFMEKAYHLFKVVMEDKVYGSLFGSFICVISFRFVFRKCKIQRPDGAMLPLNYTEQFYTLLYQSCLLMIFSLLLLPFGLIKGSEEVLKQIYNITSIVISIIVYKQLLDIGWLKSIWKVFLSYFILFILILLFIIIVGIVIFNFIWSAK